MATPPESLTQPLFLEEQLQGLHGMYEQAPWLYLDFSTPQSALRRPAFLSEEEEVRKKSQSQKEREEQRMKEAKEMEQLEKDEMTRQIQMLMFENRQLRDQASGVLPLVKRRKK